MASSVVFRDAHFELLRVLMHCSGTEKDSKTFKLEIHVPTPQFRLGAQILRLGRYVK
jgi:hypothetical protein